MNWSRGIGIFRSATSTVKRISLRIIWLIGAIVLSLVLMFVSILIVPCCIGLDTILLVFVSLVLFIILKGLCPSSTKKNSCWGWLLK
ncbi:hypothetical protein LINPERHAP2_LOCUS40160 [Linum perenne]